MNLLKISRFPDFIQCLPDFSLRKLFKVRRCERCGSLNPCLNYCTIFTSFHRINFILTSFSWDLRWAENRKKKWKEKNSKKWIIHHLQLSGLNTSKESFFKTIELTIAIYVNLCWYCTFCVISCAGASKPNIRQCTLYNNNNNGILSKLYFLCNSYKPIFLACHLSMHSWINYRKACLKLWHFYKKKHIAFKPTM